MKTLRRPDGQPISRATAFRRHALLTVALLALAGCQTQAKSPSEGMFGGISETTQHGYVVSPDALQQIPVGSSRDQVLIALGSPSTTADFGNEVFYYISQTRYRARRSCPKRSSTSTWSRSTSTPSIRFRASPTTA